MTKNRILYALRVLLVAFLVFSTINYLVESPSGSITNTIMYAVMSAVLTVLAALFLLGKPDDFK